MSEANRSPNSSEIREQLSALMDGVLPRDETRFLLRRVDADAELAATWSRYQLVQTVLKREMFVLPDEADFSASVLARLDAPAAVPARREHRVLRWAGGGAIAAAVAVFALTLSRPPVEGTKPAPVMASVPAPAAVQPVATRLPTTDVARAEVAPTVAEPWLQRWLDPNGINYVQPASYTTPMYRADPLMRSAPGNPAYLVPGGSVPYVLRVVPTPDAAAPQTPAQRQ
ncbi:MAG TPA: sigma-E factor negative regulatory protein [Rudaea sp.]